MSVKKSDINSKLNELEELLSWFEQPDVDIEAAIAKFEKGSELAGEIREQLQSIENKITVLEKRFDQA